MLLEIIVAVLSWRISHWNLEAVSLLAGPESKTLSFGDNYTLSCRFDDYVTCSWRHDNIPVEVDQQRYSYVTQGTNTTDCSIEITSFQRIDVGVWYCKGTSNPNATGVVAESKRVMLYAEATPIILLDGIVVNDVLEIDKGNVNSSLTCSAGDMCPPDQLSWSVDGLSVTTVNMTDVCNETKCCNYNLTWSEDLDQLVNATKIACIAKFREVRTVVKIRLRQKEPGTTASTPPVSFGMMNIVLIAVGSGICLIVASFCLVACICAKQSNCETLYDEIEFKNTRNYFTSNSSLAASTRNSQFCNSKHSLLETSLVDNSCGNFEKLEHEMVIKSEFGSSASGFIMIPYSSSVRCKRDPIDSLFVNRTSNPPVKFRSLGCRDVHPRMPLPFGKSLSSASTSERIISGTYSIVRDNYPKPNSQVSKPNPQVQKPNPQSPKPNPQVPKSNHQGPKPIPQERHLYDPPYEPGF